MECDLLSAADERYREVIMAKELKRAGNARREEIISVCERLYKETSFKDITVRDIGQETSVGRTSFYTYFQTKDEIFLAILAREFDAWALELRNLRKMSRAIEKEALAAALADTLEGRTLLLKILSENPFDMEKNCREDCLAEYKAAYADAVQALAEVLERFCPQMAAADQEEFVYAFLPFLHGLYPYTVQTEQQKAALEGAGIRTGKYTAYDLAYAFLCVLLI